MISGLGRSERSREMRESEGKNSGLDNLLATYKGAVYAAVGHAFFAIYVGLKKPTVPLHSRKGKGRASSNTHPHWELNHARHPSRGGRTNTGDDSPSQPFVG